MGVLPLATNSKALWSVIAYPSSADITHVISTFVGAGAQCMYILHDKDVKKDGKPKDPHFHIAVGWAKNAPDWSKFCDIMDESGHGIGNHGAICPSKIRHPYDPECARVKGSAEELAEYFLHRDEKSRAAGKHLYSNDELKFTDKWDASGYQTYMQKRSTARKIRQDERAEKTADCAELFDIIRKYEFTEYCQLVDMLQSQYPEKLGGLLCNAYAVKSYLDSYRGYRSSEALTINKEYVKEINKLRAENERLKRELKEETQAHIEHLDRIRCAYANATGEQLPPWCEI